ncbi:hypothetical protein KP509_02G102600 [Ceratopteris richardii]|uniref:Non-structural maintenance of chromosomes element 4 n=1 Tax=Ceratopteris richardii TaxID=49495 RepID=A0A8T2VCT8_CERRI|nr:hypothetical protein KP509_02G102600 [Ceratopteris richardii]
MCQDAMTRGRTEMGTSKHKNSRRQNGDRKSLADQRLLRAQYRAVKMEIAEHNVDSGRFASVVGNLEHLHNEVCRPREQVADAQALLEITASLLASVKEFKLGPSASVLLSSIIRNFGTDNVLTEDRDEVVMDWERLGHASSSIFSDAPGLSTMMGPMDGQGKQRKKYFRRPRDSLAEIVKPEEVMDSADSEIPTDKNMETMFRVLRKHKSVCLEELVLNRRSFAQTVENIFALSFLVKDGRAEISIKDGRHVVGPMNFPSQQQRELGKGSMNQFVFRFDFKDWQSMKAIVQEGQEHMPHRGKL